MRIGNYQFSPALVPSIVVLILFPLLISLGLWQLDRAEEKRGIEANVHQAGLKAPLSLNDLDVVEQRELGKHIYRPVTAIGSYDNKHQFLYDNRTHKGMPGYHVLTPFLLKGKGAAILVNRGWIGFKGRRDNIQDISIKAVEESIQGVVKLPSESILLKESEKLTENYPQTIQSLALDEMAEALGYHFLPIVIELDKDANNGFTRDWQPYYGSIAKHNGYAMQWFAMAAVLLLLFVKLSTKKVLSTES
ncbi:MAG TPA: SURF1 family protein [Thiothrix sp.]|nr:SURF1 family protein [Thiothrix sp.]